MRIFLEQFDDFEIKFIEKQTTELILGFELLINIIGLMKGWIDGSTIIWNN